MRNTITLPLLGFAAYSGTGKTTLLEALLPKLTAAVILTWINQVKTATAYVKRGPHKC